MLVRAAYALGGLGSGFAQNEEELVVLLNKAFATSRFVSLHKHLIKCATVLYSLYYPMFAKRYLVALPIRRHAYSHRCDDLLYVSNCSVK